jgi:hypothetical protein
VFDECFEPVLFARVMNEHAIDAAVLIGPDWPLVDPVLTDRVIARHREDGSNYRFVFTQAAPGLCPGLVSRSLADEIAKNARGLGPLASLGAILGYLPVFPQVDPIAKPSCVLVPPVVRDAYRRFIADDPGGIHTCSAVLAALGAGSGERGLEADAEAIVRAAPPAVATPRELFIEATTRRLGMGQGLRGRWMNIAGDVAASSVDLSQIHLQRVLEALGPERSSVAVSFIGRGDSLLAPEFIALVRHCSASGVGAIHVRTDLNCDASRVDALLDECRDVPIDVLSVDVLAEKPETYAAITGLDAMGRVKTNVARLLALRGLSDGGLPQPWIVPRITRCDAVYEEIESFYDRWTHEAGCAIIDPMPTAIAGERIEPIDVPRAPRAWRESGVLRLRADGMLCDARGTPLGHAEHAEQALRAWCDAGRASNSAIEPKPAAPMGASA